MKCPYAVHRNRTVQTSINYDENGQQTSWQEASIDKAIFCDCLQKDCGAWDRWENKCNYNRS